MNQPRMLGFATTHWHTSIDAKAKQAELKLWHGMMKELVKPAKVFLACGTESNPALCPIDVPVINAHVPYDRPYDCMTWNYAICAYNAALWHAILNEWPFDILVGIEVDTFIANANVQDIIQEFLSRSEIACGPKWDRDFIDGSFLLLKPAGALRILHSKFEPCLYLPGKICSDNQESLITDCLRDSWWNPWPNQETIRMDYNNPLAVHKTKAPDSLVDGWPFVRMPRPGLGKLLLQRYHPHVNWDAYS